MIEKMLRPGGPSAYALAAESNMPQSTLARWKRDALIMDDMGNKKSKTKKRKRWTVEERLRVLYEASQLSNDKLGAFLRREGVHASQLEQWRESVHEAFGKQTPETRRRTQEDSKRIRSLERELDRKDKALAESAALLWLKKKPRRFGGTRTTTRRRGTADDPRTHR